MKPRSDGSAPTPLNLRWRRGRPMVEWCDFGDLAFTDPFFIHTYHRLQEGDPAVCTFETGIDELVELAECDGALAPSGFVFHMSRCGSTLVSRLLAASGQFLALGEPDPMIGLFEIPADVPEERRVEWLRALVLALGRPRRPGEIRYVIKLTSFHLLHLPLFQRAFPGTPWVFVHRDPAAVMASVLDRPTGYLRMQQRPAEAVRYLDLSMEEVRGFGREEYLACFLGRLCGFAAEQAEAAERLATERVAFVDHRRLPAAAWTEVAPFFGVEPEGEALRAMQGQSGLYSKDRRGDRIYDPVAEARRSPLPSVARRALDTWLSAPYRRVQRLDRMLAGAGRAGFTASPAR